MEYRNVSSRKKFRRSWASCRMMEYRNASSRECKKVLARMACARSFLACCNHRPEQRQQERKEPTRSMT